MSLRTDITKRRAIEALVAAPSNAKAAEALGVSMKSNFRTMLRNRFRLTAKRAHGVVLIEDANADVESKEPTMKIYLASRYSRREEMLAAAAALKELGHVVTSRWIQGNHQIDDAGLSREAAEEERARFAMEDYEDLRRADCTISFTEPPRSTSSRGGRHVEFGMAMALRQLCVVIGPRENVFHCLPQVPVHATFADFLKLINVHTAVALLAKSSRA